ncbi:TetR/AcrR family transcriptional regulator [Gracilibacillus salinarum]|uniref:TetR/AcrR family transcriptional regulator n=1 Tax=Gracilibacillus salinarum TaxID=2932255 RepID=A0ABY4GKL8_9BACI|nr:TetR/AcrR family transcriptional regulator [Gracilibacillus salinarum]UOQ84774.1 TetR/AcrR family transcriptional regulator [Gracilibacillus salinarum]
MMKPRSRKEELEWTRNRILQVAEDLFMEKGFRAVTTREIAAKCEITQPALYYHYTDKQSLYIAMLHRFVQSIQKKLTAINETTMAKRLELMLEVLAEEHPSSIMMMIHDISVEFKEENQRKIYSLWRETYLEPFLHLFEEMRSKGELRDSIEPEEAARFCLLTIGQTISNRRQRTKSLAGEYALLVDLILHGTKKS